MGDERTRPTTPVMSPSTEALMGELYEALVKLEYPTIMQTDPKNIYWNIFSGKDRIYLLRWLLTRHSEAFSNSLKPLRDEALEDELVRQYSEMGFCQNRNILLGLCNLEDQIPTLRLLLMFMKHVKPKFLQEPSVTQKKIDEILQYYTNEEMYKFCANDEVEGKLTYDQAKKHYKKMNKEIEQFEEMAESTNSKESYEEIKKEIEESKEDQEEEKKGTNSTEEDGSKNIKEEFLKAYDKISSWKSKTREKCSLEERMEFGKNFQHISTEFSESYKMLNNVEAITKFQLPKRQKQMDIKLTDILIQTVAAMERICDYLENK